jgi:hypothetical protein
MMSLDLYLPIPQSRTPTARNPSMVFGFGKKQPQKTFKVRVNEFWDWFPKNAEALFKMIESGETEPLSSTVAPLMHASMPEMAWVFGPGESGGHSFTVSGEGSLPKQLLAEFWLSLAPEVPRWTFHASRQPSSENLLAEMSVALRGGEAVNTTELLIQTTVDAESESINVLCWHPAFANLPEEDRYQILFLFLDEALGEFGTETWLGEIAVEPFASDKNTISLDKLPMKIEHVKAYYKWEKFSPLQTYSVYEVGEQGNGPRGDTLFGSTTIPKVVMEFIQRKGKLKDYSLQGTGAAFAYLAIDGSVFPDGQQLDVRSNIEEAIGDALENADSGRVLGGAFGLSQSYIDLILFDGETSEGIVNKMLGQLQLENRAKLMPMG